MEANVLHCGDNLEIMRGMESESVDLIYAGTAIQYGQGAKSRVWVEDFTCLRI